MANISRGLSGIAREIFEDAQREAEAVLLKAESEGKTILSEARTEAERRYSSIVNKSGVELRVKRQEIDNVLDIEVRNLLLKAREDMVEEVFERTQDRLRQYASSENYLSCLSELISEANSHIGSDKLVISLNKRDHRLLSEKQLKTVSKKLKIELVKSDEFIDSIGGVVVSSLDGKIVVNNTFENRLQVLKPILRATIGRILFEEGSESERKER